MNAVARAFAVAALAVVATTAPAQTYVVSQAGGPGVQFTDMPQAVAAVPSGATLVVLPGLYSNFTIDAKSLTVLGGPGVQMFQLGHAAVTVQNLAPQQTVILHGFELFSALGPGAITCVSCQGTVVVQSCRLVMGLGGSMGGRLEVHACREVRALDCEFFAGSDRAVVVDSSNVYLAHVRATAQIWGYSAITLASATAELVDCYAWSSGFLGTLSLDAGSTARVSGATTLQNVQLAAIDGSGSVELAPSVQLAAIGPLIAGTVTAVVRDMPSLAVAPLPLALTGTFSLRLPAVGVGGLFVGAPLPATAVLPSSALLAIDPSWAIAVAGGVGGPLSVAYAFPVGPATAGLRVAVQGWSHDAIEGMQLSNALQLVLW